MVSGWHEDGSIFEGEGSARLSGTWDYINRSRGERQKGQGHRVLTGRR